MIKYIGVEFSKFIREKIKYSLLVLLIPSIIVFLMYAFNEKYPLVEWNDYFTTTITFLNYMVCPIVYGVITAYIFGNEYENKEINVLFSYPIKKIKILFSKYLFIFTLITSTLFTVFLTSLLLGLTIKHNSLTISILIYYFSEFIKMIVIHFMLIYIVSALAIYTKAVLPSIIVIIGASVANLVIVNTPISYFYPWSVPSLLCVHQNIGRTYIPYNICIITLIVIFLIGITISIKKYKYIE